MIVTAARAPVSLAPGGTLDRYELLCPIAEGGMASLWIARLRGKHGFTKLVAVKTILPRFAADTRFREMFLNEARIASRVDHPNVAQIFDLGEEQGLLYLVMEYVEGDSLSKLNRTCQKKGLSIPPGIVLRVLADACAGLHEAHELRGDTAEPLGVVHRDISPHNLLVSTRGLVKLIDFGIAMSASGEGDSGVLKGKIQYMAPEQALGQPIDRRADVWAAGAILYHLLSGRSPYEGDNPLATLHLLGSGVPPPPLPPEVHPVLAAVVRKALAHEPAKRYPTAGDLREAIERAMVVANLSTSTTDVSRFVNDLLSDRIKRRRDTLDRALAASVSRMRQAEAVEANGAKGDCVAPEGLAVSEPPHGGGSYATLGSATLDASRWAGTAKDRRSGRMAAVVALGAAAVIALVLAWMRPRGPTVATAAGASRDATLQRRQPSEPPPPPAPPDPSADAVDRPDDHGAMWIAPVATPVMPPSAPAPSASTVAPEKRHKRPRGVE